MTKKQFFITLIFMISLSYFLGFNSYKITHKPIVKTVKCIVPKVVYKTKQGVILDITYETLAKDIVTNYSFLSKNQQVQILSAIKKASKTYNINPLVLYSLISVESSFRFWIKSPRRLVVGSDGKKHYDNARGLMSIMPTIWLKELKTHKIISVASELYEIEPNIMAGSYILKVLRDRNKGNTIKALEAYFGKSNYAKTYQRKIRAKIGSLIEKEIL